ncbi:hypothetical protein [Photobacterium frigidiphilum]|uniref:hypothetical protein n=1 Tax=Photobacterium frigidiphilum TaxID=264736 RepID=UPI001474C83D|nr:hypothetical protein [Photobacterium frigidiphilum]
MTAETDYLHGGAIRAALPWLGLLLIFLMLITYIPQISLFLPEYIDSLRVPIKLLD